MDSLTKSFYYCLFASKCIQHLHHPIQQWTQYDVITTKNFYLGSSQWFFEFTHTSKRMFRESGRSTTHHIASLDAMLSCSRKYFKLKKVMSAYFAVFSISKSVQIGDTIFVVNTYTSCNDVIIFGSDKESTTIIFFHIIDKIVIVFFTYRTKAFLWW